MLFASFSVFISLEALRLKYFHPLCDVLTSTPAIRYRAGYRTSDGAEFKCDTWMAYTLGVSLSIQTFLLLVSSIPAQGGSRRVDSMQGCLCAPFYAIRHIDISTGPEYAFDAFGAWLASLSDAQARKCSA